MRRSYVLAFTALTAIRLTAATAATAQQQNDPAERAWRVEGLRKAFCVQFLMDPASKALGDLPQGYRPVPASEAADLHVSLRSVVVDQPEFAAWSPARLCFDAADTIRTDEFTLGDKSGRHPQLFASWTVLAASPGGPPGDVALKLFSNSDRLIRSARTAGQEVHQARLLVGLVPAEDDEGVASTDERFQVKVGKTMVTWDGHAARDSTAVKEPVRRRWTANSTRGGRTAIGEVVLSPAFEHAMAGSLKVDGKDDFAKALRASPTRFAGPVYRGGTGSISFAQ
jgi:hypothetical protein